ncbi:hydrogenase expression/formation C-terminal domain-containing protein [Thioalkalivibrio sp. ALJT]|uniref:hydrogenase expression/formation C-terminal domain-containing protein n=1 Tax=Thioalkalivibrio sp. ALJT TaxID=1158146 RepID=UPI00036F92FE|nr:hydrogenase expression/formation C-terminal domain-containing protein [Thioalkalivibrio sp. ALJT]
MSLGDIPIKVDFDAGPQPDAGLNTAMVMALLQEIATHLNDVANGGERQVVELGNLPLSDADIVLLEQKLGRGEVHATVSAAGPSEIYETTFPGLWWVKYFNDAESLVSQQLEIGPAPMILEAHRVDIEDSAQRFPALFDSPELFASPETESP